MNAATKTAIDRLCAMADIPANRETAMLRVTIEQELRAQDERTRHACAEAMLNLPHDMQHVDAHDACINVQAV